MKQTKSSDLSIPRANYAEFRSRLIDLLSNDKTPKAEYLLGQFESKLVDGELSEPPEVRRSAAITKWLQSEVFNRATSIRLMHVNEEDVLGNRGDFSITAEDVLFTAKRFIEETLGATVPWDELSGSFSGGASTSIKRGVGTIARKYSEGSNITEGAIMHFLRLSQSAVWAPRDFVITEGNVMFTVPKSSQIDRCAAKEPDYNMYVQKAIGDSIRRALRRVGINLNDQSLNQGLSMIGSMDGSLATLDLSSASDSVTRQLVLMLLPEEWFYLMDDVRSPITMIDGVPHENIMFSSMGNAFTFELESLIFWAIARACAYLSGVRGKISVYGDDIICPTGMYELLVSALDFAGFRVNAKKSFSDGPFRESCGSHWHSGTDITPFYVKAVPLDVSDWIHLLNSLRRWAHVASGILDPDYYDLWATFAKRLVPQPLWGASDLSSVKQLVAPGRRPIAEVAPKKLENRRQQAALSHGAYLHWLDASKDRPLPSLSWDSDLTNPIPRIANLETSRMDSDGSLVLRRSKATELRGCSMFPQELEQR